MDQLEGPVVDRLISDFHAEMRRGLAGERSSIAMHPAFVARPVGKERGRFVALDFGGTNVRATIVDLPGDGAIRVLRSESFRLPTTSGTASDLFDPIARFLSTVLDSERSHTLGFIFAFPMDQTGLRAGRLSKWTKEFAFEGVEGYEVVGLLEETIRRESSHHPALCGLSVGALANDTVGVLAAGAYLDPRCDMGLIVGTGTNMAVAVPTDRIAKDLSPAAGNPNEMLFNMECGNFDGVRSIQTAYDVQLDAESDTQGQLLEKMVSGRYLGEIVRLRVADLAGRGEAFDGWTSDGNAFGTPYTLTSEHLADITHDTSADLTAVGMTLSRLGAPGATPSDRRLLYDVCTSISRRSAQLVAMAIVATATYIDPGLERQHVVAVDGSVFRGITGYQVEVECGIAEILKDPAGQITVAYLRDGSGLGAAVVAAV